MSKNRYFIKNSKGHIVRTVQWNKGKLFVVRNLTNRRIEFLSGTEQLEKDKIAHKILFELSKSDVGSQEYKLRGIGSISTEAYEDEFRPLVRATDEEVDRFPLILRWSTGSYVAAVLLVIVSSWAYEKFIVDEPEPVVVKVIRQNVDRSTPTVRASKKKVRKPRVVKKATKKRKKVASKSNTKSRRHRTKKRSYNNRPSSVNLHKVGALGALGGMNKKFNGAGGLNLNAKKNRAGVGYGGAAARGGHARSLVGKGLVAAGSGRSTSVKGYGGYGTKGKGGGKPGYGSMKIAGSSAAYFEPLSEESLIEGGLDRDQINAVIQRNRGQVTYCYEKGLQADPSLAGRVEVKFVISPKGRVSAAKVQDTSLDARPVENCIVNRLRKWKFPKPVGSVNVRVTYPFILKRLSQG